MPRFSWVVSCICILIDFKCAFSIFKMVLSFSKCIYLYHVLVMQVAFYGFTDGACCHTLNLASTAWVLYSPAKDLVSSGAVFLGPTTNNIVEYEAVIGLLTEAVSQYVHNLVVLMDSKRVGTCTLRVFSFDNSAVFVSCKRSYGSK